MNRFPNGSRVCFVGDSLVASNLPLPRIIDHYNKYFPDSNVRFFNCGTSGGTYESLINFFDDDILSHKPTHAVVAYGVNDSQRDLLANPRSAERLSRLTAAYERYKKNVEGAYQLLSSHGIKMIICTPAPYDEYTPGENAPLHGAYALMLAYADFIRSFAKENGIELCDYHAYLSNILQTETEAVYSPDRVHPNPHGYYLIAKAFLMHQGLTIDGEEPIPEYLGEWSQTVGRLRVIFGTEHMLIKNYAMPLEEKMEMMEKRVREENWGRPVFERFIRGFVAEKRNQDALYKKLDELYERDIIGYYAK